MALINIRQGFDVAVDESERERERPKNDPLQNIDSLTDKIKSCPSEVAIVHGNFDFLNCQQLKQITSDLLLFLCVSSMSDCYEFVLYHSNAEPCVVWYAVWPQKFSVPNHYHMAIGCHAMPLSNIMSSIFITN